MNGIDSSFMFGGIMLHLIKLCVGAQSVEHLRVWQRARLDYMTRAGLPPEFAHHTRQTPKSADALISGGSLYWVIGGFILARQRLIAIRPEPDESGRVKCGLILAPEIIETEPYPRRPFQGWRYLKPEDAPRDLASDADQKDVPLFMRKELASLGLL